MKNEKDNNQCHIHSTPNLDCQLCFPGGKNVFPHPHTFTVAPESVESMFNIDEDDQSDILVVDANDWDRLLTCYRSLYNHAFPAHNNPPVKKICETCGSDEVMGDAYAEWNVALQEWDVAGGDIMSGGHVCEECDGECEIATVPVDFVLRAICGTCGIYDDDGETGYCKNGHDNWIELPDFYKQDLIISHIAPAEKIFGVMAYEIKEAILKGKVLTPITK